MDYSKIEELLNKYFEGNTSLEDENELRMFYINDINIPSNLMYAKPLFVHLEEEKKTVLPTKIVMLKSQPRVLYIVGIAASLFIALFFIFANIKSEEKIIYAYVNGKAITDKHQAELYTKQILLAVSQNLDKGTKNLNYINKFNQFELLIKKNKE